VFKIVSLTTLLMAGSASAQTLDNFSKSFAAGLEKECNSIQRANPQNQNLTDGQIGQYCNCVARHSLEVITMDEIFSLQKTGERPPSMQRKLNALGETCVDVLLGKVRDTPIH